jgi:ankyrin repeat protein
MSELNMPPPVANRQELDAADAESVPQLPGIRYDNNIAQGNSRNIYGKVTKTYNTYNYAPQGAPAEPVFTPDAPSTIVKNIEEFMGLLRYEQMDDRLATIATAQLDTCQWLFQRKEYRAWQDPDATATNCGFLWLKGKPGAGKSTLMKSAQRHGEREHKDLVISFFFNARGTGLQKSRQGMCRSLLHQLLRQRARQLAALSAQVDHSHHYKLLEGVMERLPQWRNRSTSQDWPIELLEDMLRDLSLAFSPARVADALTETVDGEGSETYRNAMLALAQTRVICYVDALDECEGDGSDEARDVIEFLDSLRTNAVKADFDFRVLLSSRHYPHITFDACQQLIIEDQEGHETDITEYIRSKLRLKNCKLADQIKLGIQTGASGVFLWVVLVVRIMNDLYDRGKVHLLRQKLAIIPTELHQLFNTMLQKDTKDGDDLLLTLQWILFAERPLTLEEFYHAVTGTLEYDDGSEDLDQHLVSADDMSRFLLSASKGLAEMTKSNFPKVQFIHESVKDYLRDAGLVALAPSLGANPVEKCHARLQQCCRCYLERVQIVLSPLLADADALQPPTPDGFEPEGSLRPAQMLLWDAKDNCPFLEYATESIVYHAESAYLPGSPLGDFVAAFPHETWLRIYSLLNPARAETRTGMSEKESLLYILILESALRLADAFIEAPEMPLEWSKTILPVHHRSFLGPAIANGDGAMVAMLLGHGIGANWPAKDGHTCLSLAVEKRDDKIVQMLIDAGATADSRANHPWGSAKLRASLRLTSKEVRCNVLMSDVYPTCWHDDLSWILYDAKLKGNLEAEQILVSRLEAVVKEVETGQASPIEPCHEFAFLAACANDLPDIIPRLAKHGVNPNSTRSGNTGLSIATLRCYPKVVKALLKVGADPNICNDSGDFPIHEAAREGRDEILRMLLGSEVDPSAADEGPPHTAAMHGKETAILLPFDNVANINAQNASQEQPLYLAALHSRSTSVRLLLDRGANIHDVDDWDKSALLAASYNRNFEILDMLLDAGDPTPIEQLTRAALKAMRDGKSDVVHRLVQKGAKRPRGYMT